MPKYYEGKEESGRPCSGFREDLQSCLLESDCVLKVRQGRAGGKRLAATTSNDC